MKKIGFLGGSFNPPHYGHLLAAVYAHKEGNFDEVWLAPTFKHAFDKKLISFDARMQMCTHLVEGHQALKVVDIEKRVDFGGRSYPLLAHLSKEYPYNSFTLIIGSDTLKDRDKWFNFSAIEKEFGTFVVPRGAEASEFFIPNISSTEIRKRIASKQSVAGMTSKKIAEMYIQLVN